MGNQDGTVVRREIAKNGYKGWSGTQELKETN